MVERDSANERRKPGALRYLAYITIPAWSLKHSHRIGSMHGRIHILQYGARSLVPYSSWLRSLQLSPWGPATMDRLSLIWLAVLLSGSSCFSPRAGGATDRSDPGDQAARTGRTIAGSLELRFVQQLLQLVSQRPESALHVLKLLEESHGLFPVENSGRTGVEHGDGAPHRFEFR
jgi:hypothetical protein